MKIEVLSFTCVLVGCLAYMIDAEQTFRVNINKGDQNGIHGRSRPGRWYGKTAIPEPLKNANNFLYYGTISLGTPDQNVTCDFDTGSADLWVPTKSCTSDSCSRHKKFDSSASSTFKNGTRTFEIEYGDGSNAKGYTAYDNVNINGLKVTKQGFALVNYEKGFDNDPMDCMFGLGYKTCASTRFATPIDNAYSQGTLSKKVFAFWLNRNKTDKNGGELIIGGTDPNHYTGDITYAPVTEKCYWQFEMSEVTAEVDSQTTTVCNGGCQAIADSGTSWIYGEQNDVDTLLTAIGAEFDETKELYTVDCDNVSTLPDIVFNIAGRDFPLKPSAYIFQAGGSCFITIIPSSDSLWILGDNFMGAYYTVFDGEKNQVGFAVAK